MKAAPPPLLIGKACPMRWDQLEGGPKRRFCEQCQLHVHNLSAMSGRERARFVRESGGRACIAYRLNADGTLHAPTLWGRVTWPLRHPKAAAMAILGVLMPFAFSACTQTEPLPPTLGVPMPPPTADEGKKPSA